MRPDGDVRRPAAVAGHVWRAPPPPHHDIISGEGAPSAEKRAFLWLSAHTLMRSPPPLSPHREGLVAVCAHVAGTAAAQRAVVYTTGVIRPCGYFNAPHLPSIKVRAAAVWNVGPDGGEF